MRTHIIMGLLALIFTACASKRDIARLPSAQGEEYQEDLSEHAQMIDSAASARGDSIH